MPKTKRTNKDCTIIRSMIRAGGDLPRVSGDKCYGYHLSPCTTCKLHIALKPITPVSTQEDKRRMTVVYDKKCPEGLFYLPTKTKED